MELLLHAVRELPEYHTLAVQLAKGNAVGVSGAAQLCCTHIVASLLRDLDSPTLLVCRDEMAATRLAGELKSFLGEEYPILPRRELTLYDASAVSRGWEHRRLRLLHALASGSLRCLIAPIAALR